MKSEFSGARLLSMWEHESLRTLQGDAGVAMLRYAALLARGRDVSFVRGRKASEKSALTFRRRLADFSGSLLPVNCMHIFELGTNIRGRSSRIRGAAAIYSSEVLRPS